jgi:hypothetical protein
MSGIPLVVLFGSAPDDVLPGLLCPITGGMLGIPPGSYVGIPGNAVLIAAIDTIAAIIKKILFNSIAISILLEIF